MLSNKNNYFMRSSNSSNLIDSCIPNQGEDRELEFKFTDVNGYALPAETLPNMYKHYIVNKYQLASPLLREEWRKALPTAPNFLSLVDKNNVAFNVSVKELNRILLSGYFTMDEQKAIKKMRYQGRNNQAAKVMREKYKLKDSSFSCNLQSLKKEKSELLAEKEKLIAEIKQYEKFFAEERENQNKHTTPHQ